MRIAGIIQGKLADIKLGSQVKIYGSSNENNVLILDSISVYTTRGIQTSKPMRVSGTLDNIDLENENLTIFGVPIKLLPNTLFRDMSG